MSEQLEERLDRFERALAELSDELAALRRLAGSAPRRPSSRASRNRCGRVWTRPRSRLRLKRLPLGSR